LVGFERVEEGKVFLFIFFQKRSWREREEEEKEEEEGPKSGIKGQLFNKESVFFVCLDRKEARA
jgi:hypothetical protein